MVQFNVRKFTGKTGSRSVCGYFVKFSKRPSKRLVRLNPSQSADLKNIHKFARNIALICVQNNTFKDDSFES